MPKILVNYLYNKKNDTYSLVNNSVVFADMPIAVMEMGVQYDEILVVPINKQNTVVDKEEYLKTNKKFKLIADENGKLEESPNGVSIWLPKDTNIQNLRIINDQLVLVEEKEEGGNE